LPGGTAGADADSYSQEGTELSEITLQKAKLLTGIDE
jgi:hypothetical protein